MNNSDATDTARFVIQSPDGEHVVTARVALAASGAAVPLDSNPGGGLPTD